jgi:hypothetical protein
MATTMMLKSTLEIPLLTPEHKLIMKALLSLLCLLHWRRADLVVEILVLVDRSKRPLHRGNTKLEGLLPRSQV